MRGSSKHQTLSLYHLSGIDGIGEKKHGTKQKLIAEGKTMHEIGKELKIFTYNAKNNQTSTWATLLDFARSDRFKKVHGKDIRIFDIEKLTPYRCYLFILSLLSDRQKSYGRDTLVQYCARIEKLEAALNRYAKKQNTGRAYDFSKKMYQARLAVYKAYDVSDTLGNRAFCDPMRFIREVKRREYRIAAILQFECGARAREICHLREENIDGDRILLTNTKGGLRRYINPDAETLQEIKDIIKAKGMFRIDYQSYLEALRAPCEAMGIAWNGTHGLRWTFAQDMFAKLGDDPKMTFDARCLAVSKMLGHWRPDITCRYTGGRKIYVKKENLTDENL